jgi:hypothetical protein
MGELFIAATSARNLPEDESRHPILLSDPFRSLSDANSQGGKRPCGRAVPRMNNSRESFRVGSNQNLPDNSPAPATR